MGLSVNNNSNAEQTNQLNLAALAESVKAGDAEAAKAAMAEIAPLLSSVNVSVTKTSAGGVLVTATKKNVTTDVPELDEPLEFSKSVDLEALIAFLQIENEEEQLKVAKTRIEAMKGGIEADHLSVQASIEKGVQEAIEAEEAAKKQKFIGRFCAIFAIAAMVVIGIATGGAAAAIIGAAVMTTFFVLNETGVMSKAVEALSDALQDTGMSKADADKLARFIIGVAELTVALAATLGGPKAAKAIGKLLKSAFKGLKNFFKKLFSKEGAKALAKGGGLKALKTAAKKVGKGAEKVATKDGGKAVAKEGEKVAVKEGEKVVAKEGEKVATKEGEKVATKEGEKVATKEGEGKMTELDDLDGQGKKVEKSGDAEVKGKDVDGTDEAAKNKQKAKEMKGNIAQLAVMGGTTVAMTGASINTAVYQEEADEASAAVKEAQAFLNELSERLEDEKDVLEAILQYMNDNMAALADILESQSDVNIKITQHIGG